MPIATLPSPSITNLSLVPITDEEEILNLPTSAKSVPIAQLFRNLFSAEPDAVDEAEKTSCGEPAAVVLAVYKVTRPYGVEVPMPMLPAVIVKPLFPVSNPPNVPVDAVENAPVDVVVALPLTQSALETES